MTVDLTEDEIMVLLLLIQVNSRPATEGTVGASLLAKLKAVQNHIPKDLTQHIN